jgi:hypothetical protein
MSFRPRFHWSVLAAAWFGWIGAVLAWIERTPIDRLREQLIHYQFWSLEIAFLAFAALSYLCIPALLRLTNLTQAGWRPLLAASGAALVLAAWGAPKTSRIFFDEQIYQEIGQNLADLKRAQMCDDGNVEYGTLQCWRGEYNKEPYGYPYLLSIPYRVLGVRESTAFVVNTIADALLVLVVGLIAALLTGQAEAGAYAALIAALMPEQLRWSHTAAAEPTAALACALAVLAAVYFSRVRTTVALLWVAAACAVAVQFRPECVLIVPVVVGTIALLAPAEPGSPRFWWAGLLTACLLSLYAAQVVVVGHEPWGSSGPRFSLAYLAGNLQTNGWFFLGDPRFPWVYTLLAFAALVFVRPWRALAVPALHFLFFWGIFLVFYAGSYSYGADDRFSLMAYPGLAVLAGAGAWQLAHRLRARAWGGVRTGGLVVTALIVQFLWYLPFVRSVGEEAWGARADVEFARGFAAQLPPNSIVLTQDPNMFHVWGRSAAQAAIAVSEPGYVERILAPRYAGGVFFHWNFWCNVDDPVQKAFCTDLLARFPHTLIREYRERTYRYALYRLDVPPGDKP